MARQLGLPHNMYSPGDYNITYRMNSSPDSDFTVRNSTFSAQSQLEKRSPLDTESVDTDVEYRKQHNSYNHNRFNRVLQVQPPIRTRRLENKRSVPSLELSGVCYFQQNVETPNDDNSRDDDVTHYEEAIRNLEKQIDSDHKSFTPRKLKVSHLYDSHFGLRDVNVDTFSGLITQRKIKNQENFEKGLEEIAKRHIEACQAWNTTYRRSRALRGLGALRETMSNSSSQRPIQFGPIGDRQDRQKRPSKFVKKMPMQFDKNSQSPMLPGISGNTVTPRRTEQQIAH